MFVSQDWFEPVHHHHHHEHLVMREKRESMYRQVGNFASREFCEPGF